MQTKIHEPTQIVEVMLTHAEQADEAVKKQLKELYAQYKGTKYTVVVFLSGKRDLYEDTRDLLLFNRRRAAERAVQARQSGQGSECGQGRGGSASSSAKFFAACNGE